MGQRNPAPPKGWLKTWDVYHRFQLVIRISLAHPQYHAKDAVVFCTWRGTTLQNGEPFRLMGILCGYLLHS
jgi:hypothetical protein